MFISFCRDGLEARTSNRASFWCDNFIFHFIKQPDRRRIFKQLSVRHELALQSGLAVFEEYPDLKDNKVKLEGDNVVEFHQKLL